MPIYIFQVSMHVPDGSSKELTTEDYEELVQDTLDHALDSGLLSGVSQVAVAFEDCV